MTQYENIKYLVQYFLKCRRNATHVVIIYINGTLWGGARTTDVATFDVVAKPEPSWSSETTEPSYLSFYATYTASCAWKREREEREREREREREGCMTANLIGTDLFFSSWLASLTSWMRAPITCWRERESACVCVCACVCVRVHVCVCASESAREIEST